MALRRAPYPRDNGARIRAHHLLTGLAEAFDVTLVTFEHHPLSPDGLCRKGELEELYPGVKVVTVPGTGPSKRMSQAVSLLSPRSWNIGRYRSRAFIEAVRGAAASTGSRIVHFDELETAQYGPLPGVFNVYGSHNVEAQILKHGSKSGGPARRLFYRAEAQKVGKEESRAWRSMDLTLAVSPVDAEAMIEGGARRVEICPNGAPAVERLAVEPRGDGEPLRLLFVGSGSYLPYERGLAWFVREVLPRIQASVPVVLDVVGNPPANPVEADGVRFVGRVPSVEPYYAAAHGFIVPVFEGSGTRLKILEAMAYGRPVISTRIGAEGLPVAPDEHFFSADDAEGFAAAAEVLAGWSLKPEEGDVARMVASAREAARPFFWPNVVARLAELYRAEIDSLELPARDRQRVR
jgi:glycosyltransferase involved in cell wall biosynthesis